VQNNLLNSGYVVYQDLNGNKKFDDPLTLKNSQEGKGGYYQSGIDNTIIKHQTTKNFLFHHFISV